MASSDRASVVVENLEDLEDLTDDNDDFYSTCPFMFDPEID